MLKKTVNEIREQHIITPTAASNPSEASLDACGDDFWLKRVIFLRDSNFDMLKVSNQGNAE